MKKWQNIITGITSIIVLALNLSLIQNASSDIGGEISDAEFMEGSFLHLAQRNGTLLSVIFLVIAVSSVTLAILCRHEKGSFARYVMYAVLSLAACVIPFVQGKTVEACRLSCALYLGGMVVSRVISIFCGKSKLNILLIILLIAGSLLFWFVPAFFILLSLLIIDVQAIAHVVLITFSRIRMDILKKIIRRTYAVEILLGIILLIVAFSLFMPLFEENISSFPDALWYCFAIVTTIGFGDIYATSAVGRIMSVILGIYGIIVVALVTSIIVNFYGELRKEDEQKDDQSS